MAVLLTLLLSLPVSARAQSLGVGATERAMSDHGRVMYDVVEPHAFLKLQLGAHERPKGRLVSPPELAYTSTENGPNKVRVSREEFSRGLKDLKP